MTATTSVPFSKLIASDEINARGATKDGLDELAASIAAKGLIQPLAVRPADGTDKYEVIDGRRRHQAMAKLVKAKTWTKSEPVPVLVRNEDDAEALETSLMANTVRLPMHPVDQHEVFARLAAQGKTASDIAGRFGVTERQVRQQMALGNLAPEIRKAWRGGKINDEIARAFASTTDHAQQTATYERLKKQGPHDLSGHAVRRALAPDRPSATRVAARTLELYQQRGGTLTEDLFEDARYIDNPLLLAAVRTDLRAELKTQLEDEGWSWVARSDELPPRWRWSWQRLSADIDDDDIAEQTDAERAEYGRLSSIGRDADGYVAAQTRLFEIEDAVDLRNYPPAVRGKAGAVILIEHDGSISIERGILRPAEDADDMADDLDDGETEGGQETCPDCGGVDPAECLTCNGTGLVDLEAEDEDLPAVSSMVGDADDDEDEGDGFKISGALTQSLTENLTVAAAEALRTSPDLAMRLVTAALTCRFKAPVAVSTEGHHTVRRHGNQPFNEALSRILALDQTKASIEFAAAVAGTLDLTDGTWKFKGRDTGIDDLVAALPAGTFNDAAVEQFLPADYFKRAPKAAALAAIEEMREAGCAAGLAPVDALAAMKKGELADAATKAATAANWLPPQLRHPAYALIVPEPNTRLTGKSAASEQTSEMPSSERTEAA